MFDFYQFFSIGFNVFNRKQQSICSHFIKRKINTRWQALVFICMACFCVSCNEPIFVSSKEGPDTPINPDNLDLKPFKKHPPMIKITKPPKNTPKTEPSEPPEEPLPTLKSSDLGSASPDVKEATLALPSLVESDFSSEAKPSGIILPTTTESAFPMERSHASFVVGSTQLESPLAKETTLILLTSESDFSPSGGQILLTTNSLDFPAATNTAMTLASVKPEISIESETAVFATKSMKQKLPFAKEVAFVLPASESKFASKNGQTLFKATPFKSELPIAKEAAFALFSLQSKLPVENGNTTLVAESTQSILPSYKKATATLLASESDSPFRNGNATLVAESTQSILPSYKKARLY